MIRPGPSWAKSTAFLKLSGVLGEAADRDHKDWIVIESFSWGALRSGTTPIYSGATGNGKGYGEIKITKAVDRSSPKLAEFLTNGRRSSEVILEFARPDGKPGHRTYLLKNIAIMSKIAGRPVPRGGTMKGLKPGAPGQWNPGQENLEDIRLSLHSICLLEM